MKKKVVLYHLYNDYSGSPHVLATIIRGLMQQGGDVELVVSDSPGFLSGIEGLRYRFFRYTWTPSKLLTFIRLVFAQIHMFLIACRYPAKDTVFYLNTICPSGAALAARIKGIPVVYHVHEAYVCPNVVHRFYRQVWKRCATRTIFVSAWLKDYYGTDGAHSAVVYSGLSEQFLSGILPAASPGYSKTVLMVSSLKAYKGVNQFVALAGLLPQYRFNLVVNVREEEVHSFFGADLPTNLQIYPRQTDIHPFLSKADVVVNLSIPSLCIETFGLTLLEAFSYGIPVICPPVGGPLELVTDGCEGFAVDSRELDKVAEKIVFLLESGVYEDFSKAAWVKSVQFTSARQLEGIMQQLNVFD